MPLFTRKGSVHGFGHLWHGVVSNVDRRALGLMNVCKRD